MYEVNYNGWTSYCEQLFLLTYSTGKTVIWCYEHDLLAVAKFLVAHCNAIMPETVQNTTQVIVIFTNRKSDTPFRLILKLLILNNRTVS